MWKVDVPGRSWSSPVVWGDHVFVTTVVRVNGSFPALKPVPEYRGLSWNGSLDEKSIETTSEAVELLRVLGRQPYHDLPDLGEDERERRVDEALALYADYGRGADGMQMPWVARCFKATVVERPWQVPHGLDEHPEQHTNEAPAAANGTAAPDSVGVLEPVVVDPEVQDASDSDLLLIDFR